MEVIDFEQEGLSELEVQTLTQRFISELEKTAKAILFDGEVVRSQIRSAGYELNACKKADCVVAAIGDSLGMQYIITGSIEKNKERYGLSALLTDVVTCLLYTSDAADE